MALNRLIRIKPGCITKPRIKSATDTPAAGSPTPHLNTLKHKIDQRTKISHTPHIDTHNAFKIDCPPDVETKFSRKPVTSYLLDSFLGINMYNNKGLDPRIRQYINEETKIMLSLISEHRK